jgi:hypothetical protein
MVFVEFEDRSKVIRYWDKATRKIKVLRNVAFSENEELTNLEEVGKVPGVPAEGEIEKDPASTPAQDTTKSKLQEVPQVHAKTTEPETRNLRLKPRINYKQLNNLPLENHSNTLQLIGLEGSAIRGRYCHVL